MSASWAVVAVVRRNKGICASQSDRTDVESRAHGVYTPYADPRTEHAFASGTVCVEPRRLVITPATTDSAARAAPELCPCGPSRRPWP
jgi:hypothetical protein